jgi:hypothetical protein
MTSPEEIWSTRLQRELIALTTATSTTTAATADANANANADASDEAHHTELLNKKDIGVLPPFLSVKEHTLDIEGGSCTISFTIQVDATVNVDVDAGADAADVKKVEENDTDSAATTPTTPTTTSTIETQPTPTSEVVITLDASLQQKYNNNNSNNNSNKYDASLSYPFAKPKAYITSGANLLPSSANITNGCMLHIDCDWTPSLHLNDAALNLALKVRESVKRDEVCLMKVDVDDTTTASRKEKQNENDTPFDLKGVSNFFSSLKTKATAIVEEVDSKIDVAMKNNNKPRMMLKKKKDRNQDSGSSNKSTDDGTDADTTSGSASSAATSTSTTTATSTATSTATTNYVTPKKVITEENVEIGDLIDLSQSPWNTAVGMYPCNAIRIPKFVEEEKTKAAEKAAAAVAAAAGELKGRKKKVAGSGFAGAGSMFKSFSMSAKSLVEESFLVLTKELILEIKCSKFSVSTATVTYCIPISFLSKLKFRREESISLFFKPAPDDPIIYMCQSSAAAVKQIQTILKEHGVKGKHTNATMTKAVQIAVEFLNDIKEREQVLVDDPRPDKVTDIMDLYRQAAEKFEMAGDKRHEEVMALMREFLALPLVSGILDGSIQPKETAAVEESNILEPIDDDEEEEDDDDDNKDDTVADNDDESELGASMDMSTEIDMAVNRDGEDEDRAVADDEDLDKAMKAAEDMLNNAHDELKDLGVGDDDFENDPEDDLENFEDDDDNVLSSTKLPTTSTSDSNDVVSEFEDMLADADKELEELMGS